MQKKLEIDHLSQVLVRMEELREGINHRTCLLIHVLKHSISITQSHAGEGLFDVTHQVMPDREDRLIASSIEFIQIRDAIQHLGIDWSYNVFVTLATTRREKKSSKKEIESFHGSGVVYFIRAIHGGLIKIGFAENVERRLSHLQSSCPLQLEVIGGIPKSSLSRERALHKKFDALRQHGEWFLPSEELLTFINKDASQW